MISRFTKFIIYVFVVFTITLMIGKTTYAFNTDSYSMTQSTIVQFNDINLENCIRSKLNKPTGNITSEDMKAITDLFASSSYIKDLKGLEFAINLIDLYLDNNQITDISPLSSLVNLKYVLLDNNSIDDISPLANLTKLENFQANGNNIMDISPLANLTRLTSLGLNYNSISNITALSKLNELTNLGLSGNPINDISEIGNLKKLINLDLSRIMTNDLTPLSNLTNLEWLHMPSNYVKDIKPLENLYKLSYLDISYNQIEDISPLANLTQMNYLSASNNQIIDIKPLEKMNKLMYLYLNNNEIEDITPLHTIAYNGGFQPNGNIDFAYNQVDLSTGTENLNVYMELYLMGININGRPQNKVITVKGISLGQEELSLMPGEEFQLTWLVLPTEAENQNVMIESNNPEIATVDRSGRVKALREGIALITVTTEEGGFTDQCLVTVTDKSSIISFPDKNLELAVRWALSKPDGYITNLDMSKLTSLKAYGSGIMDLSGIEYAKNLIDLVLWENQITDIKPLASLEKLTHLDINTNRVKDISPLAKLTNLNYANLSYNQITDISPVKDLSNLIGISFSNNSINNIESLANLTGLKDLNLDNNLISDVSVLSNLKNLEGISLGGNEITDITPLSGLTKLKVLVLNSNKINDIGAVSNLTELEQLAAEKNMVADISPLKDLTKLWTLLLSDNIISDISGLANLTNLRDIGLGNNPIKDISILANFNRLDYINLKGLGLEKIDFLSNFPLLKTLDLSDNLISDIGFIKDIPTLEAIVLNHNKITDVSPFKGMQKIEQIYLDDNYIEDIKSLEGLYSLDVLRINNNRVKDITPIVNIADGGGFKYLKAIYIRENLIDIGTGSLADTQIKYLQGKGKNVYYAPQKISNRVRSVTIEPSTLTLDLGKEYRLNAIIKPSFVENWNVVWSSSNPEVVRVDTKGNIRGLKAGTSVITVTTEDGGYTSKCTVTVAAPIPPSEIVLKDTYVKMGKGNNYIKLDYTILPENSTNKKVEWISSDDSIALADSQGYIWGISKGTVTITARIAGTNISAACTVEVIPVEKVTLSETFIQTQIGVRQRLSAIITPAEAVNSNVTWESSSPSTVSVDSSGNIKALRSGEAVIYARSIEDNNIYGECRVVVENPPVSVKSIKLNIGKASLSTTEGYNTVQLSALIAPDNATNKDVEWTSKYPEVASVDGSGMVTAIKSGTTIITAITKSGGKKAACTITVAPVAGIKLSKSNTSISLGKYTTLKATISPSNAAVNNVVWSVSQGDSVAVTSSGKVMPVKPGTSVVTVTALDGGKTASCTVTVTGEYEVRVADMILKEIKPLVLSTGKKYTVKPALVGENKLKPTNPNLLWKSSDESIAVVDEKGIITAKAPGTAIISIQALGGDNVIKEVAVEVVQPITSIIMDKSLKLLLNEDREITAIINPWNITQENIIIEWSKSDRNNVLEFTGLPAIIADEYGKLYLRANVKAVKKGSATIYLMIKTKDGTYKKASCSVSVK